MKKRLLLFAVLAIAVILEAMAVWAGKRTAWLNVGEDGLPVIEVKCDNERERILPWLEETAGVYYFFLPAFVGDNTVYYDLREEGGLIVDGNFCGDKGELRWEENKTYKISWGGSVVYNVQFAKSGNLPAVFLETQSGSLAGLDADKRNSETGQIQVVQSTGNVEYKGRIEKISKRGQATSGMPKMSLSVTLEEKESLCGLEAGKKWNFLSLYFERNKIQTKLVYDMADYLGLEYTSGCTWVDLYCNGEYEGLYLLTEAVMEGEGRVDIYDLERELKRVNGDTDFDSLELVYDGNLAYYDVQSPNYIDGGYLIEKKYNNRLAESGKAHFVTDRGMAFEIEAPRHPSREQVEYIASYVQRISDMLQEGNLNYRNYLDMDSFAREYLIDMIALDSDAMNESTFYYLDTDRILKSGPLWDYDMALGNASSNYAILVGEGWGGMRDWYQPLYQDEEFRGKMLAYYRELLPFLNELLHEGIDRYVEWISPSLSMDVKRWGMTGYTAMFYQNYENYVRYLKYFLLKRVEFLSEEWDIASGIKVPEGLYREEKHTVTLEDKEGNVVGSFAVKDGECIKELPEPGADCEYGWTFFGWYRTYDDKMPIFEDTLLTAR